MKRNIFKFLSAAALVGVTTLSLTSCKVVDTIKGWFDDDPVETTKPEETTPPETTDGDVIVDGQEVKTGSVVDMPQNLTFRKASANNEGITIRATVLPENATEKKLVWSVSWLDNSLTFIDVDDFIEICPSEDTLSCTIKCLSAFGHDVVLTVSSGSVSKNISVGYIPLNPISDGYDFSIVSYDDENNWIDEYFFSTIDNQLVFESPNDSLFNFMIWNYKDLSTNNYYCSDYVYHYDRYFKVGEESFKTSSYDIDVAGVNIRFTQDFYSCLETRWSEKYTSNLVNFISSNVLPYNQGLGLLDLDHDGLQDSNILHYCVNSSISSNQTDLIINAMKECLSNDIYIFELEIFLNYCDREGTVVYSCDYVGSFNPEVKEKYVAVSDICVSTDDIIFKD